MPLNSFVCAKCGSRNNYVVDADRRRQTVECSSCQTPMSIGWDDLPDRVKESIADLKNDSKIFEDVTLEENMSDDPVEDALKAVESKFSHARSTLSSFDSVLHIESDENDPSARFRREVAEEIRQFQSEPTSKRRNAKQQFKEEVFDQFTDADVPSSIIGAIDDELDARGRDDALAHIVSYAREVAERGVPLDALADDELLALSDLSRKEKFLVRQLAKHSDKLRSLQQYL